MSEELQLGTLTLVKGANQPRTGPPENQLEQVLKREGRIALVIGAQEGNAPPSGVPKATQEALMAATHARLWQEFIELNEKEIKGALTPTEQARMRELAEIIPKYAPGGTGGRRRKTRRRSRKSRKQTRRMKKRN